MTNKPHIIPDTAIKGVAIGLCMMAFFTLLWAGIAFGGLHSSNYWLALLIFPLFSLIFIMNALQLFKIARLFPKVTSEADIAEEKQTGKWFGIIFGAEGLGIFVGINIVNNIGHPELDIPVIALVVGLHFLPLAKVFKRTVDYYLGGCATLIALLAFVFTLNKTFTQSQMMVFVGIGIAMATSCYGFYMVMNGRRLAKLVPME
jgi:hypothetical protein